VFVVTGDGLSIGGNHMLHVLRRNVNLTILLSTTGSTSDEGQYRRRASSGR